MPLPTPETSRRHLHTRSIRVQSYAREDGLWDLEAELIDVKGYDFKKKGDVLHPAGQPIHHMHLRVTIDDELTIVSAQAAYDAAPYGTECTRIDSAYAGLAGLNLLRDFRRQVKERFARTAGCTHMTELAQVLPTVAIQTMAGRRRSEAAPERRPFQLGGCHAQRLDGPVVREHYPRWYVPSRAPASGPEDAPTVSSHLSSK